MKTTNDVGSNRLARDLLARNVLPSKLDNPAIQPPKPMPHCWLGRGFASNYLDSTTLYFSACNPSTPHPVQLVRTLERSLNIFFLKHTPCTLVVMEALD